jgi:hypothetical protein
MIKLNFKDGSTLEFDLKKEDDLKQWLEWSFQKDFQNKITGIGILHEKKFHILPYPYGFKRVRFMAEIVVREKKGVKRELGEKLICQADNIQLSILVYTYKNPPSPILARTDIVKMRSRSWSIQDLKEGNNGNRND